jgi:hypothetical protein
MYKWLLLGKVRAQAISDGNGSGAPIIYAPSCHCAKADQSLKSRRGFMSIIFGGVQFVFERTMNANTQLRFLLVEQKCVLVSIVRVRATIYSKQ